MYAGITRAEQNLLLLQSMIPKDEKLYVWCYNASGEFVASSCPESYQSMLDHAFRVMGGFQKVMNLSENPEEKYPRILGSAIGMQWAVTYESERKKDLFFIIGPVFYTMPKENTLRPALYAVAALADSQTWIQALCASLPALPVMTHAVFTRYVLMVHNTLTGEQLGLEVFSSQSGAQPEIGSQPVGERNRLQVYQAEQALLQMVRAGAGEGSAASDEDQHHRVYHPGKPCRHGGRTVAGGCLFSWRLLYSDCGRLPGQRRAGRPGPGYVSRFYLPGSLCAFQSELFPRHSEML